MTMQPKMSPHKGWMAAVALAVVALAAAGSLHLVGQQRSRTATIPPIRTGAAWDPLDEPPMTFGDRMAPMEARRLRALNADRQKALVAQTNRLVKMATDLNTQINSQDLSQLTPGQLQQLAEIEKLAHSIRDKMSTPVVRPMPEPHFPPMPYIP